MYLLQDSLIKRQAIRATLLMLCKGSPKQKVKERSGSRKVQYTKKKPLPAPIALALLLLFSFSWLFLPLNPKLMMGTYYEAEGEVR